MPHTVFSEVWKHGLKNYFQVSFIYFLNVMTAHPGPKLGKVRNDECKRKWRQMRKNGHIPDPWSGSTMPWSLSSVEHLEAVLAESPCQVADLRSSAVCASLGRKGLGAKNRKVTHCIVSLEPFLACTDLLLLWVCYYYKKSFAGLLCSCKLHPSVGTKWWDLLGKEYGLKDDEKDQE